MPQVTRITPDFAVAPALQAEEFDAVAAQGYRMVINFLPDGETKSQVSSEEARKLCERTGMAYFHVPTQKFGVFAEEVIGAARRALASQQYSPVLAYCASGQRAAIVWAAVNAQATPVETVLSTLKAAGFDLSYIRDDLELQADRPHWRKAVGAVEASQDIQPCT